MDNRPTPNSTLVERIRFYVDTDQEKQAERLARLADFLEACVSYEVSWGSEV